MLIALDDKFVCFLMHQYSTVVISVVRIFYSRVLNDAECLLFLYITNIAAAAVTTTITK